jgi:hypothetical protein
MKTPADFAAPSPAKTAAALIYPTETHTNTLINNDSSLGIRFATSPRIEMIQGDPP